MGTNRGIENLKRGAVEKSIRPDQYDAILRLWLQGQTLTAISEALGIPRTTLHKFIESRIQPMMRMQQARSIKAVLAEIRMLKAWAWRKLEAAENPLEEVRFDEAVAGEAAADVVLAPERFRRKALRRYLNASAPGYAAIIQWCLEQECKLGGHYRTPEQPAEQGYRVAGMSPTECQDRMIKRIMARAKELHELDQLTAESGEHFLE